MAARHSESTALTAAVVLIVLGIIVWGIRFVNESGPPVRPTLNDSQEQGRTPRTVMVEYVINSPSLRFPGQQKSDTRMTSQ